MIKISKFWNGLLMLAAGALVVSCADYNVTDDFRAEPDPSFVEPYKDLGPVKISISRKWLMLPQSLTSTMSLLVQR